MYSENYEEEEEKVEQSGNTLINFYNNNKKLVWVLGIIIIFVIIASIFNKSGSGNTDTPPEVLVPELVLTNTEESVGINTSKKIEASVTNYPSATLNFSSSDSGIVEVSNYGLITGVSLGNATITVTYIHTDGTPFTKECKVTVFEGNENSKLTNVNFPEGDLMMSSGNTFNLGTRLVVEPSDGYIEKKVFQSSNPGVASINEEGIVKAVSAGNAEISVTVNDTFTSKINVYVLSEMIISEIVTNPKTITFTSSLVRVKIGEIKLLDYVLTPENANKNNLTWSSSDESVATVSNGEIRALKEGNTVISVKSITGVENKTVVEVIEDLIPVDSVTYHQSQIEMLEGGTLIFEPQVSPTNASDKSLKFSISDNSIASVSTNSEGFSATIYAHSKGTTTLTFTSNSDSTKKGSVTIVVSKQSSGGGGGGGSSKKASVSCTDINDSNGTCTVSNGKITGTIKSNNTKVASYVSKVNDTSFITRGVSSGKTTFTVEVDGKEVKSNEIMVTISSKIGTMNPGVTISGVYDSTNAGVRKFDESAMVTGTFTNKINSTSCIKFAYGNNYTTVPAKTINTKYGVPLNVTCSGSVTITFVPDDKDYYTFTRTINVTPSSSKPTKTTPTITIPSNIDIYSSVHDFATINEKASVAGKFTNTISDTNCLEFTNNNWKSFGVDGVKTYGIVVRAKKSSCTSNVTATFTPNDTSKYNIVTKTVKVTVH